ncbi:MAG: DUF3015 domain-containing protein [Bdellovibrionota bacterium]
MMKKIAAMAVLAVVPSLALADNIGTCGWGSKLMEGNSGIAPQVLAVTTNGTSGNQTFGITSGTSGCTQDGVVHSTWKTAMFVDGNMNKLARDMSVGHGETLDSLANLMGMDDAHKGIFFQAAKDNFAKIFSSDAVTSQEVVASLKEVVGQNAELAQYSARL